MSIILLTGQVSLHVVKATATLEDGGLKAHDLLRDVALRISLQAKAIVDTTTGVRLLLILNKQSVVLAFK